MPKKRKNLATARSKKAREALQTMRTAVPSRKRPQNENPDNPLVKCPACGRVTQADMFRDVSEFNVGVDFACDGCTSRWRREGKI